MRETIHDIRNHLTIAMTNIEAIVDGKLEASPQRLEAVLKALRLIATLVETLSLEVREPKGPGSPAA